MRESPDSAPIGFDYYALVLRRQWIAIVAGAVLGLIVAGVVLVAAPPRTTATADVRITVISSDPFGASGQSTNALDPTTEAQVAMSYAVAHRAAARLGSASASAVRRAVSVDAVTDKNIVHVSFAAASAEKARAGANSVAAAYLAYRSSEANAKRDAMSNALSVRIKALEADLMDAGNRLAAARPTSAAASQARNDQSVLTTELATLGTEQAQLQQIDTSGGSVLTPAEQNPATKSPAAILVLLTGLLAGLVVGVIVAFPLNARDKRWRSAAEAERATGAPVLADIHGEDAAIPQTSDGLEAFRMARERLLATLPAGARILTIVDDTSGGGVSDIPVNLALALAENGQSVELVPPGLSVDQQETLRGCLRLGEPVKDDDGVQLRSRSTRGLRVYLPVHEQGELISSAVRSRVGASRSRQFYVLALPQKATTSTVLSALRLSDAVVLVATLGSTTTTWASQLLSDSRDLDVPFLGTITGSKKRRGFGVPDSPSPDFAMATDQPESLGVRG
jgi:capsular polysaccharide biosynthesis protein